MTFQECVRLKIICACSYKPRALSGNLLHQVFNAFLYDMMGVLFYYQK